MYYRWMKHIKLPQEIILRVKNYNEHIFSKYKGLDEDKILSELPSTTRQEIFEFLLTEYFLFSLNFLTLLQFTRS